MNMVRVHPNWPNWFSGGFPTPSASIKFPPQDPDRFASQCAVLLKDSSQWNLEAATFEELLAFLPGPYARALPQRFQADREKLVLSALNFLNQKSQIARPSEKTQKALQHSIRAILESNQFSYYTDCAALKLLNTYFDASLVPFLIEKLKWINSGFAADCRDLLMKNPSPEIITEIKKRVSAQIAEETLDRLNRPRDRPSPVPFLCDTLRRLLNDDAQWVDFLKSVQPDLFHLAAIHHFKLPSGEFLTGSGVIGCVFDGEFDKYHPDFGGNIFLQKQLSLDDEHGTLVVSTWAGRTSGIAPQTLLTGERGEGTTVDHLQFWTSRILEAARKANHRQTHPRIFCLSVGPSLEELKTPEDQKGYADALVKWHEACALAFAANIVILISAGNQAAGDPPVSAEGGQLQPIGLNSHVLRVGACVQRDFGVWHVAHYSARGGSTFSPNFVAPANRLAACCGSYEIFPGTSCAAPVAAGVISLMIQANPQLTAQEIFDILNATATPLPETPPTHQGAGMIHPEAALFESLRRVSPELAKDFRKHLP